MFCRFTEAERKKTLLWRESLGKAENSGRTKNLERTENLGRTENFGRAKNSGKTENLGRTENAGGGENEGRARIQKNREELALKETTEKIITIRKPRQVFDLNTEKIGGNVNPHPVCKYTKE